MKSLIHRMVTASLVGMFLLCGSVIAADKGVFWQFYEDEKKAIVFVDWCHANSSNPVRDCQAAAGKPEQKRITSEYNVTMQVSSFNYVGYDFKVDVQANEVEVYTYLNALWGEILGGLGGVGAKGDGSKSLTSRYWNGIQTLKTDFTDRVNSFYSQLPAHLTSRNIAYFKMDVGTSDDAFTTKLANLETLRNLAFEEISSDGAKPNQVEAFKLAESEFLKIKAVVKDFIIRANKSINGSSQSFGKQKAGFIVSVVLTPSAREGTGTDDKLLTAIDFDYPVQSKYPLLFHIGATYANIEDIGYEKVRGLSGEDLFLKVKKGDGLQNFSAFLSHPVDGENMSEAKWYGTIGTDITNIGDNVYAGISYKFNEKWLLSGGVAYGLVTELDGETQEEGSDDVEEPMKPGRTLYQIVEEDRETAWFISISYVIF